MVNKTKISFLIVGFLIHLNFSAEPYVEKNSKKAIPRHPSLMTLRVSLLDASQKTSTVSTSLTALRPLEINMGLSSSFVNSYFVNAGLAIPWDSEIQAFTGKMEKEFLMLLGYRYEERSSFYSNLSSDDGRPDQVHALSFLVGIEAVEWINDFVGVDITLGLGFKFWLTRWVDSTPMDPLGDISFGIAF